MGQGVHIGHDCTLGDFVTLQPRVRLGGSFAGHGALIGANATALSGLSIGEHAWSGRARWWCATFRRTAVWPAFPQAQCAGVSPGFATAKMLCHFVLTCPDAR
ncbi:MAG: hypothetical protein JWM95_2526 [Gemmatimonadetes bacterium]|nr:hypothetical protein [Gemmatimonadota bacterium]